LNFRLETAKKFSLAYRQVCRPLCRELGLPQTAFDILMFLGNNPAYKTARDIVEMRRIKANLVSVHVDRLVREGYLERQQVPGDRRKTLLLCTDKAQPVIAKGRLLQEDFFEKLLDGMDEEERNAFSAALHRIGENLDAILEEET
jgi:DNA-binding MarR family transcriptional regulator